MANRARCCPWSGQEGVPIVPLQIAGLTSFRYDFGASKNLLDNLELELEKANPGACDSIREAGVDLADVQRTLASTIPSLISKRYEPSASANVLAAQLEDLVVAMEDTRQNPAVEQEP